MELSERQQGTLQELLKQYENECNSYTAKDQEAAIKETIRYFVSYVFIEFDSDVLQEFLRVIKNDRSDT